MPRDDHIIAGTELRVPEFRCECRFEAPPDAVARNGVANLFGDRKAKARPSAATRRSRGPFTHFDQECRRRLPPAAADSEKLGSRFERWQNRNDSLQSRKNAGSGASALDPLRPKDACGPSRDGVPKPSGRQPSACVCEIRGGACEQGGSVDMCASRKSPSKSLKAAVHTGLTVDEAAKLLLVFRWLQKRVGRAKNPSRLRMSPEFRPL